MADQSDVEQALAAIVAGVLYPDGPGRSSVVERPCRVHRGWPAAATLDGDLLAGRITVTVAGEAAGLRNTTRFPDEWRALRPVPVTLSAFVRGSTVTFGGAADAGQLAGVLVGHVAGVHRTLAGDTPGSVARALAIALAAAPGLSATQVLGDTVTVPTRLGIVARVQADQPSLRETRRQMQGFRIICWCPDPDSRDAVAGAIDAALSAYDFLGLPDGMAGRLRFLGTTSTDRAQAASLYRRDLIYGVDYATTLGADLPRLLFGDTRVFSNGAPIKTLLS